MSPTPGAPNNTDAPCERPIQLRCMVLTLSGQSSTSRSSINLSEYAVIRIIHCRRRLRNTGKLPRSLRPSAVTSSLASTVPNPGHQLTTESDWYTRRYESITSARAPTLSSSHTVPSEGVRVPESNSAISSWMGLARRACSSYQAL
ncbi:Uncharacterised protein [Mycobacteroides abscessus]|nr:Uncharacterised protein [Mycobacteroides abscessus]